MEKFLHQTFYFGAGLGFVYCLGQLVYRRLRPERIVLALFFFLTGLILLHAGLYHAKDVENVPLLFLVNVPALYMIGPLLLAYFSLMAQAGLPGHGPRKRFFALHLLPGVAAALMLAPVYFASGEAKAMIIADIRRGTDNHFIVPLFITGLAWALVYSLYIPFRLRIFRTVGVSGEYRKPAAALLLIFTAAAMLGNLGYLLGSLLFLKLAYLTITAGLILIYVLGLRYPRLVIYLAAARESSPALHRLRNLNLDDLEKRLQYLMIEQAAYADEDLDLKRLAELLSITPAQLSQFINGRLGQNFNAFINGHRVRAAGEMLLKEKKRSILSIAHAVGFNSTSVFHDAFKKAAGMSPGEFRKRGGGNPEFRIGQES